MNPRGNTSISKHYRPAVFIASRRCSDSVDDLRLPDRSAPLQKCLPMLVSAVGPGCVKTSDRNGNE